MKLNPMVAAFTLIGLSSIPIGIGLALALNGSSIYFLALPIIFTIPTAAGFVITVNLALAEGKTVERLHTIFEKFHTHHDLGL